MLLNATSVFPIVIASIGLLSSLIGIGYVLHHKASDKPQRELDNATYISAGIMLVASLITSLIAFSGIELYDSFRFGWVSPWISSAVGIISGVAIGKITEYYTGLNSKPVKE